jgi:sodium transport system permease protein
MPEHRNRIHRGSVRSHHMLTPVLTIARKELIDSARDLRSLLSSSLYCLMGPGVVLMVSFAMKSASEPGTAVIAGMLSVFTLVSVFSGGMNVGMDLLAGERERRSLLPLLMNPVARRDIIAGKWLAIVCFSAAGLVVNLAGSGAVLAVAGTSGFANASDFVLLFACGLAPLAMLAAAMELTISTACRTVKEAHTYLSMVVFVPMLLGMFGVFFPKSDEWLQYLPVTGQQWQLQRWITGSDVPAIPALMNGIMTLAFAVATLLAGAKLIESDDVVYGS